MAIEMSTIKQCTLVKRRKLEPAYQSEELFIRGWFAELAVGAGGVELSHEYKM
jgi:hypothetical protein